MPITRQGLPSRGRLYGSTHGRARGCGVTQPQICETLLDFHGVLHPRGDSYWSRRAGTRHLSGPRPTPPRLRTPRSRFRTTVGTSWPAPRWRPFSTDSNGESWVLPSGIPGGGSRFTVPRYCGLEPTTAQPGTDQRRQAITDTWRRPSCGCNCSVHRELTRPPRSATFMATDAYSLFIGARQKGGTANGNDAGSDQATPG